MRGAFLRAMFVACVVCLAAPAVAASAEAKTGSKAGKPNIVLITTDDQPLSTFTREHMPETFRRLVDRGTSFTDAIVNVPLCCPSRATLITGQYPHNHGVLANDPGYGSLVHPRNVLPVWLRRAGYRTAHFGKWLHGYEVVRGTRPAPGWDRWLAQLNSRRYYDYKLSNDGRVVKKGSRRRDHLTGVITRAVSRYLAENLSRRKPLFLQLHQYAPHIGAAPGVAGGSRCAAAPEPSPRDRRTIKDRVAPRSPSFNEADVSDKPYYFQPPPLDAVQLESVDRRYRCTLESLAGVDRSVKRIFKRLHKAGELRNTAFVFLTDNGFFLGEHRIRKGKARPWEEAIRTPLVVRPPRAFGELGAEVAEQVGSIDVVPTILDLAGAEPCRGGRCRAMDGRSLLPPMRGRVGELRDRALLIEMADNSRDPRDFACHFEALRTSDDVLIRNTEFPDPDTRQCEPGVLYEHYAIDADPFQLGNRIGPTGLPATPRQLRLADRLDRLRGCSGIEDRDPATSGGWCD